MCKFLEQIQHPSWQEVIFEKLMNEKNFETSQVKVEWMTQLGLKVKRSELVEACKRGNAKRIRELLLEGVNPNCCSETGRSCFLIGLEGGCDEIEKLLLQYSGEEVLYTESLSQEVSERKIENVKKLLEGGANPNLPPFDLEFLEFDIKPILNTPIHIACEKGDEEMISLLLDSGAEINGIFEDHESPFDLLCKCEAMNAETQMTVFQKVFIHGADPNRVEKEKKMTPFLLACSNKSFSAEILTLFLQHGAEVNSFDSNGRTALNFAYSTFNEVELEKIREAFGKNAVSAFSLLFEVKGNFLESARFLLEKGFKIEVSFLGEVKSVEMLKLIIEFTNDTILVQEILTHYCGDKIETKIDLVRYLLDCGVCQVNRVSTSDKPVVGFQTTALLSAITNKKDLKVVKLLLAHGANPSLPDPKNNCFSCTSATQEVKDLLALFSEKETIWNIENHQFFPTNFRSRVEIFLRLNKFSIPSHLKIPKYILYQIFQLASLKSYDPEFK